MISLRTEVTVDDFTIKISRSKQVKHGVRVLTSRTSFGQLQISQIMTLKTKCLLEIAHFTATSEKLYVKICVDNVEKTSLYTQQKIFFAEVFRE